MGGCFGVCSMNCNYETEDWCDMGTDSHGCWMGNWCQDKSMGGCPPPDYMGIELASGDVCAHVTTWTETCTETQTSCSLGYSPENCWYGNYCANDGACIGSPSGAPSPSSGYGHATAPSGAPSPSTGYGYGAPGVEMVRTDGTGYGYDTGYGTGYGYGTGTGYGYGFGDYY